MIKFYERRKIFFAISLILFVVGIVSVFINGINLSIQFKGGAIIKYTFTGELNTGEIGDFVTKVLGRDTEVQITEDLATNTKKVVLNLSGNSGLDASQQDELDLKLKEKYADLDMEFSESNVVQPFIGKRFLMNGIIAIALSSIFIILYVGYRFKKISGLSSGIIGIFALLHDCLIVFFTFALFKFPINDSFVAVILTIIGYSINDTIVIYDRIRENAPLYAKKPYEELIDDSINQTLSRSINTSVATGASILIVYVFAHIYNIDSIKVFALPMLFGIISGCYSSVCLTGPMMVMWHKIKEKRAA